MRIIFLTSGSGSTAYYISRKLITITTTSTTYDTIKNLGFVYESNDVIEYRIAELKNELKHELKNDGNGNSNGNNSSDMNFYCVNRNDFSDNDEFHKNIWNNITSAKLAIRPDIIILAGWMHIVPKSFITTCNNNGIKIINLHPTLQYQLIGRDIYPKIWQMYQDGMIRETGCMVHYVSSSVDRGELIQEMKLDLTKCKTFDDYHKAMYGVVYDTKWNITDGLEKRCLWTALTKLNEIHKAKQLEVIDITPETFSRANKLVLAHRGKVRDIYESEYYKDYLFVQTSDRISANDIVIAYLPQKGYLLNQINAFWHKLFGIAQMVCGTNDNLMVIRKMRAIPLEIIVRRRITGSLWKAYSQKGLREINGYELPAGLTDGDVFEEPIVTPTTKGTHDIPITFDEIIERGILNKREVGIIRDKAVGLFKMGESYMKGLGIEMIDTKFEFAFDDSGNIELIDEVFTPDSSRFIVNGVRMDKDVLRRWATENEAFILSHPAREDGCRGVKLPTDIAKRLILNYSSFLDKLNSYKINYRCVVDNNDGEAISKLEKFVVILAGSKSDSAHVEKLRSELAKVDILSFVHYSSAHKNTEAVMEILQNYEYRRSSKIVYITVAGLSNALSGVVSANVSRPVIACPPFADKADYQVNIHSTLQMPSGVPSACVLRPDNVAGFCKRLFAL